MIFKKFNFLNHPKSASTINGPMIQDIKEIAKIGLPIETQNDNVKRIQINF